MTNTMPCPSSAPVRGHNPMEDDRNEEFTCDLCGAPTPEDTYFVMKKNGDHLWLCEDCYAEWEDC